MFTEEKPTPPGEAFQYGKVSVREKPRYKEIRKAHHLPEFSQLTFVEILLESIR
jgi:hypothetical protein